MQNESEKYQMAKVFLVKSGSISRDDAGNILDARSTVSLIDTGRQRIVVDTGQQGDEAEIVLGLKALDLELDDIDAVVNTHSHPDHCANNQIFSRARTLYLRDGDVISPGVWIMETSGHSLDSISVVANAIWEKSARRIVISGDALPTFGNYEKNVPPALHVDRDLAVMSMRKILSIADVVIPGHDRPFYVYEGRIY